MGATPAGTPQTAITAGVLFVALAKLAFERRLLDHADEEKADLRSKSARLLLGELGLLWRVRVLLGLVGGVVLPVTFLAESAPGWALAALAVLVAGELIERHLFFVAGVTHVMPGGVAS
jgi:DMSO reductase anchor subunit